MRIAVLGATGKTGRYLVACLCERGHAVEAVGRDPGRLAGLDARARRIEADIEDPGALEAALAPARCVVNLAHARHTGAVLAALPADCERLVNVGSTRAFSALTDPAAEAVREGERAFAESGRPGVMLHPNMIYGTPEDRNVSRLLRLLARWPRWLPLVVPLPAGGRHTVQPIFVDDMVAALVGAIERAEALGPPVVVAGPEPITYAAMVRAVASALGRRAHIVGLPTAALSTLAGIAAGLGVRPPFDAAELRRAGEDKHHEVREMFARLGVTPRPFAAGLAERLARDAP